MQAIDKLLGCLLGAALGDAMGAATETRTISQIYKDFGGWVTTLIPPPPDCFARNRPAGTVTDDFSMGYYAAWELAYCQGRVDTDLAKRALLIWAEHPEFLLFAGPTTHSALKRLQGEVLPDPNAYLACNNHRATNGAAMKIFSVGLINPGQLDKAITDAMTLSMPTHDNNTAIAAAAAIACAVARAMDPTATLEDVLEAGQYGAARGNALAISAGLECAMPSVEKRIHLAIEIGRRGLGWEQTLRELAAVIGSGLAAADSIPTVFGILAAVGNDSMSALCMGVNIGNDTDTIASMVGAIVGALHGTFGLPLDALMQIEQVNGFDIRGLAIALKEGYYP